MRLMVNLVMLRRAKVLPEAFHAPTVTALHCISNGLARQQMHRLGVFGGQLIVRQVRMEI
jgi:hypothetical protein